MKNKAAQQLGRLGGKVTSEAKAAAVRENGKLGGRRPRVYLVGCFDKRDFFICHAKHFVGLAEAREYAKTFNTSGRFGNPVTHACWIGDCVNHYTKL